MINTDLLLERSRLLLSQKRFKEAEASIRQLLECDPENDEALSFLARCYLDTRRIDEAIQLLLKALAIDPSNSFYHYLLGFAYYHKNKHDDSIEKLNKAISLYPYQPEYYGLLAYVRIEKNEFETALEKANEGLSLDAKNITCLNARSVALNKLKRTKDAIETMKGALSFDPENEMTHSTAGWNYLEKGKRKEAAGHFIEALRINPNHSNAQIGLKEALKSKILPYKWLLQYSFWIRTKGAKWQRGLPIVLFLIFRVLVFMSNEVSGDNMLVFTMAGIYILLLVTTWTINSIANFFLLFDRKGKYGLTISEKWSAITVCGSLITGIATLIVLAFHPNNDHLLMAAIIFVSLALPLGRLTYPIQIKNQKWKQWYKLSLLLLGLFSLLLIPFTSNLSIVFFGIYVAGLVVFTWLGVARDL